MMFLLAGTLLAVTVPVLSQLPPGFAPPLPPAALPPAMPPPPYNMYGPINPYATTSTSTSVSYVPPPPAGPPSPPLYPPLGPQQQQPGSPGTVPYSASSLYPMLASPASPFPAYGIPPNMMYQPPYQTFSGPGAAGDPFSPGPSGGIFNPRAIGHMLRLGRRKRRR